MPTQFPGPSHAQLTLKAIHLIRGGQPVLQDLNLAVTTTSRIGIVGENGRGKTSLLHIITGRLEPDAGTVLRHGSLTVAEQEMPADDDRTVGDAIAEAITPSVAALAALENAASGLLDGAPGAEEKYSLALDTAQRLDAWDAQRRVEIALESLGAHTDPTIRLDTLSVGQRYLVRLACLLGGHDDFLLLDEPTNHLDREALDFLTRTLRARSGGVVVVTHDRRLLADVAETILSLDPTPDGMPRLYGTDYAGYVARSRAERAQWEQDFSRQQDEHARLVADLASAQDRLIDGWRPGKGSGKHLRATRAASSVQNVQRRQAALEAHTLPIPQPPLRLVMPRLSSPSARKLLTANQVSVAGRLEKQVSVTLSGGDRLVITGPNGAGKSTLLAVLAGQLPPTTGTVQHRKAGQHHKAGQHQGSVRIALLEQEARLPFEPIAGEFFAAHVHRLLARRVIRHDQAVSLTSLGLLSADEQQQRIGELSMGQQRRLDFALLLATRPQVLLLDEPTNHLSIRLVDELTEALEHTGCAVVLTTHDRQLLADTAHWPRLELA